MVEKKINVRSEAGIFARRNIPEGTLLFSYDDWIQDEKEGWVRLSLEELNEFSPEERAIFLRYGYDIDFGMVTGTLDWTKARHISNFMNHSCLPNMMYDFHDNIIAKRDIEAGEELTIDYGTFIVNVDQDFICCCGSELCRRRVTRDDWKTLIYEYGYHFPRFMHTEIRKILDMNKTA